MAHQAGFPFFDEKSRNEHSSFAPPVGVTSSTPLPSRRRAVKTPLHAIHRAHPDSINLLKQSSSVYGPARSSPLRTGAAQEFAAPSVFVAPNALSRKRSHYTAVASSSSAPMLVNSSTNASIPVYAPVPSAYSHAATAVSHVDAPDLDSDASWYLGGHDSPSTSRTSSSAHGSWSRRQHHQFHTRYSEPQTSHPSRPPQGEFSFQPPSTSQHVGLNGPNIDSRDNSLTDMPESSSSAFARLAQAQRQQQESQRMAASGASTSMDDHAEGPATKKRRSVAGTLMDGALNAALYTGAAAFTAYSLWSKWGRKGSDDEAGHDDDGSQKSDKFDSIERLPPGGLEEPPPPYIEQTNAIAPSSSRRHNTLSSSATRPVHVFVSSRRRRPVFATHRSVHGTPKRRSAIPDFASDISATSTPSVATKAYGHDRTMSSFGTDTNNTTLDDDSEGEDDDEMFKRFQAKMSSLIEEGTRALNSKAELSEMDLEEEDEREMSTPSTSILSPSTSEPVRFGARDPYKTPPMRTIGLPQSRSAAHVSGNIPGSRTSSIPLPVDRHVDSPRATYLTLAGRDVNSPYGRLARRQTPTPALSTPRRPL